MSLTSRRARPNVGTLLWVRMGDKRRWRKRRTAAARSGTAAASASTAARPATPSARSKQPARPRTTARPSGIADAIGPLGPDGTVPGRHRRIPRSFPRALGMTVVGTVIPGAGLVAAGRRKTGLTVVAAFMAVVCAAGYLVVSHQQTLLHWAVRSDALLVIAIALPALALAWVTVIVGTYRSLLPRDTRFWQRLLGYGLVVALATTVLAPLAIAGRYAQLQRSVVDHVFASPASRSATRPTQVSAVDPWGGRDRVNLLLLGGDGGPNRVGVRPDTLVVASIDTHTGATALFSLPRNLKKVPFPPGSALARAYPHGFAGPGDQEEWLLNAIYENVPAQHPGLLQSDSPGADATKLAVGAALGLTIDYYILINLKGFRELVDALGGITVNINQRVAIGGASDEGKKPSGWIQPGPGQHLDGYHALWFARGRYGADDYQRMERQRCALKAIIDQADPVRILTRYESIAATSRDLVETDVPGFMLPAFVDLSTKIKDTSVRSTVFTNEVIQPSNPNYRQIQLDVQRAIRLSTLTFRPAAMSEPLDSACVYKRGVDD